MAIGSDETEAIQAAAARGIPDTASSQPKPDESAMMNVTSAVSSAVCTRIGQTVFKLSSR